MMTTVKWAFFGEPRPGRMGGWLWYVMAGVAVVIACAMMVDGLFFSDFSTVGGPSWSPTWFVFGLTFTLRFSAELLPKGWSVPADRLYLGAVLVGVAGLVLILVF